MDRRQDTHKVKSETSIAAAILKRPEATELVHQVAGRSFGRSTGKVLAVMKANGVGFAALTVLVAKLVELGAWKPGGWSGYYAELERRTGLGEKQLRRAMKAVRALGLVHGDPEPATRDPETGQVKRWAPGTYWLRLPVWCSARYWRNSRVRQTNALVVPTGHFAPDSRFVSKSLKGTSTVDDVETRGPPVLEAVDTGPDFAWSNLPESRRRLRRRRG